MRRWRVENNRSASKYTDRQAVASGEDGGNQSLIGSQAIVELLH
jgi:hypothetical protein